MDSLLEFAACLALLLAISPVVAGADKAPVPCGGWYNAILQRWEMQCAGDRHTQVLPIRPGELAPELLIPGKTCETSWNPWTQRLAAKCK
jgi:hypothetical protein